MRDLNGRATHALSAVAFPSVMTDRIVLGFDFGTKKIGVAIANSVTREARPLTTIAEAGIAARWAAIGELVREWQPAQLVVGIPRHPDGAAHAMTARCERFARQLEGRLGLPVARVDERYTSVTVSGGGEVDAGAAALILQQWSDAGEMGDA